MIIQNLKQIRKSYHKEKSYCKKNKKIRIVVEIGIVLISISVIGILITDNIKKDRTAKLGYEKTKDGKIVKSNLTVEHLFLTINKYSRSGKSLKEVNNIVIHYIGNPGTGAKENRDYFEGLKDSKQTYASSHFIIGLEGEIIQCIPLNEMSYCTNNRNKDTISIEVCHPDKTGKFNRKSYDSLIALCAWLCDAYKIEPKDIIRHYDVTGKQCPLYYVNNPKEWEGLKKDVDEYLKRKYE